MTEQKYPKPTVGALISNPEGKVLLIKSRKWGDRYVIPGGHIELGEKIEDALRREIKVETRMDIHDIEFFLLQEFIFDETFWKKRHFLFMDHVCKTKSKEVRLDQEGQEYVWVHPEEALELPVEPYTRRMIEKYIKEIENRET